MSNIKNEVITKLRSDIRTKLDQIGAFVDNELADYIMVLVANQKSKYQMKDDLSLFLGAATDEFVNWLHSNLKQIQLNANQSVSNEDKKVVTTSDKKEIPESKSTLDLIKTKAKHKKVFKHSIKSDKNEDNISSVDIEEDSVSDENDGNKIETQSEGVVIPQLRSDSKQLKTNTSDKQNESKEQNDGEVVLHLNVDGGDVDELLQESDVNDDKKIENKKENLVKDKALKRTVSLTPISTIGAVVVHKPKELEEEDSYDPSRPVVGSVASVVRITQRKSSVPIEMQANKSLLLKAMKDANQSTHINRKRSSVEVDYTPTPIKKRLGERQEVISEEIPEEELHPKDLRNYLRVNKKDSDKSEEKTEPTLKPNRKIRPIIESKKSDEMSPQFVVTLDGVDHNKYQNTELEDRILFDEEMDEEFIESEAMDESENVENSVLSANRVNERCHFWPSCKNGDECEFVHPSTPCKTFPNCRFGDKCLYIHPNCKFDSMCSRRDCPFTHASRRKAIPTSAAIISSLLPPSSVKQCKYVPNCKNPACPYFHPKLCRFGPKCRNNNCHFIHPTLNYSAQPSVPHPNQLKWKAKDHISERQFFQSTDNDSKTKTTST